MSNGVGQMVTNVTRMAKPGEVDVLRLWSHGSSGGQGVSTGFPTRFSVRGQRAGISQSSLPDISPTSNGWRRTSKRRPARAAWLLGGRQRRRTETAARVAETEPARRVRRLNAQPIGTDPVGGPWRVMPDGSTTGSGRISGNGCHRRAPATIALLATGCGNAPG